MLRVWLTVGVLSLSLGCASNYVPPSSAYSKDQFDITVEQPFAIVWADLIDHISLSPYAIKHSERASGLVTIDFGTSGRDVDQYVDCGLAGEMTYTEFLRQENYLTKLGGVLNVYVWPISRGQTRVRATARYIVEAIPATRSDKPFGWAFDTAQDAEDGGRMCRPTYEAEQSILRGIESRMAARGRVRPASHR